MLAFIILTTTLAVAQTEPPSGQTSFSTPVPMQAPILPLRTQFAAPPPSAPSPNLVGFPRGTQAPASEKNGHSESNGGDSSSADSKSESAKEPHSGENGFAEFIKPKREYGCFPFRFYKAYYDEFFLSKNNGQEEPEK